MQKTRQGRSTFLAFESWAEYLDAAEHGPRVWPTYDQSSQDPEHGWAGATFPEAIRIAREGWPEGTARLVRDLEAATPLARAGITNAITYDVGGALPDVPLFVAGDPAHMITFAPTEKRAGRIVRVACNQFVSAKCSAQAINNRGAAILSWIDAIEQQGHQAELCAIYYEACRKAREHVFCTEIPVKRAGEPMELDRLAFLFAHPAMFRRLHFAIHEQHEELHYYHNGLYGLPHDPPKGDPLRGDIYFARLSLDNAHTFDTIEKAVEHVRAMFESAGMLDTPEGRLDEEMKFSPAPIPEQPAPAPTPTPTPPPRAGREIIARFPGKCRTCGASFEKGARIIYRDHATHCTTH